MTEITFEKLVTDTHKVMWRVLRDNIKDSKVKHISDGRPQELKKNAEYPHIIVGNPDSDDILDNHNIDFDTLNDLSIEIPISIYTTSASLMRELIDLVKYTLRNNHSTVVAYGLTTPTFISVPSDSIEIHDGSGRSEYKTTITVNYSWGGSQI